MEINFELLKEICDRYGATITKKEKNDEINKIINGNPFIDMENDFYQEMDKKIKKYIDYNKEFLKYLYMMEDINYKFVDDEIDLDELVDTFNMLIKNINAGYFSFKYNEEKKLCVEKNTYSFDYKIYRYRDIMEIFMQSDRDCSISYMEQLEKFLGIDRDDVLEFLENGTSHYIHIDNKFFRLTKINFIDAIKVFYKHILDWDTKQEIHKKYNNLIKFLNKDKVYIQKIKICNGIDEKYANDLKDSIMYILANREGNIELDFSEVEFMSTDFCAIIFGELSKKENANLLSRIVISNISKYDRDLIKMTIALSQKIL